jgi:hypothetical protein
MILGSSVYFSLFFLFFSFPSFFSPLFAHISTLPFLQPTDALLWNFACIWLVFLQPLSVS